MLSGFLLMLMVAHLSESSAMSKQNSCEVCLDTVKKLGCFFQERKQRCCNDQSSLLDNALKAVDRRIDALEEDIDQLKQSNAVLKKNNAALTTQVGNYAFGKRGVFSATRATPITLSRLQTVVFDTVIYNLGQDYNPKTGVFTCPITGVYLFHMAMITGNSENIFLALEMMKSGKQISKMYERKKYHATSTTVFTQCNKGERVWVRTIDYAVNFLLWGHRWPNFSGALLHPIK